MSISPKNIRDLNQGLLHLWSKFGDLSLKLVPSYRADKQVITAHKDGRTDGQTDTKTDAGNDNTRGSKLASGKKLDPLLALLTTEIWTIPKSKISAFELNVL